MCFGWLVWSGFDGFGRFVLVWVVYLCLCFPGVFALVLLGIWWFLWISCLFCLWFVCGVILVTDFGIWWFWYNSGIWWFCRVLLILCCFVFVLFSDLLRFLTFGGFCCLVALVVCFACGLVFCVGLV